MGNETCSCFSNFCKEGEKELEPYLFSHRIGKLYKYN